MRILVALLLLVAATVTVVPSASACHPDPVLPTGDAIDGWYVVRDVWYGGCPHELTACLQVWRESNGEPGLQRTGTDPDHAVIVVCPAP